MQAKFLEFEAEIREAKILGLIAEFRFRIDKDPNVYYEAFVFESREAYRAFADSPEQDA
jgi:hypothetical protein